MYMWANAYAAKDRVVTEEGDDASYVLQKASDMNVSTFLPTLGDEEELYKRMWILVSRVLCHHIPHFKKYYSDCVVHHIDHPHSKEMKEKSELVR